MRTPRLFFFFPLCLCASVVFLLGAALIVKKVSDYPNVTTPGTNDFFLLSLTNAPATNHNIKYSALKAAINATNVNGSGTSNTLAKWTGTNRLGSLANGSEGQVLGISNGVPNFINAPGGDVWTNSGTVVKLLDETNNLARMDWDVGNVIFSAWP